MSILGTGLALGACAAPADEPSTEGTQDPAVETPAAPADQQAQSGGEKVGQQSDKWVVGYPGFWGTGFYGAPYLGGWGWGGGWGIRRGFVGGWGYPGFGYGVGCGGWGCF